MQKTLKLHGKPITYETAGEGPVLLLIHGMAGDFHNWDEVVGPLAEHHLVSEVRAGVGLLGAVQIDPAVLAVDSGVTARVVGAMRRNGVLSRALIDGSVQVSPPFVVSDDEIAQAAAVIATSLDQVAAAMSVSA